MTAYEKLTETKSEDEVRLLVQKMIHWLSAVEFGSVPVMYSLGRYGALQAANWIIGILYLLVVVGKCFALQVMRGQPNSKLRETYNKVLWERQQLPCTSVKLWPKGLTIFITSIPVYCETLATALTVGSASESWTEDNQTHWAFSWSSTPLGLLSFVGWVSLPTVLALMLAVNYFGHVASLVITRNDSRWVGLTLAANASGLMLISAITIEHDDLGTGDEMMFRVASKVIMGSGPRLWLKISLLSILLREGSEATQPAILAVCLGFLHIFQVLFTYKQEIAKQVRDSASFGALFLCAVVLPSLACMIRAAGTFMCDTHMFNISTWSCVV